MDNQNDDIKIVEIKVENDICNVKFIKPMLGISKEDAIAWLEKQGGKKDEEIASKFLISKGYPISANGDIPTYNEMYNIIKDGLEDQARKAVEIAREEMIEKACQGYCDDMCEKGMCGMCYHKYDGKGQVKNTFKYNECHALQILISRLRKGNKK